MVNLKSRVVEEEQESAKARSPCALLVLVFIIPYII